MWSLGAWVTNPVPMLTKPIGPRYDGATVMAAMNVDPFYPPWDGAAQAKNFFTGKIQTTHLAPIRW